MSFQERLEYSDKNDGQSCTVLVANVNDEMKISNPCVINYFWCI